MLFRKQIGVGCILYALVYTPTALGQYKFEAPVVIGKQSGLPTTDIRSFQKGKDGFIWMGTSEGVCRFDGQQAKTFTLTEDLDQPPFTNSVNSVLPVNDKIWVGTTQGISVLNCADYTFKHYQFSNTGKAASLKKQIDQQVSVLFCDGDGKIWIGTRDKGYAHMTKPKMIFIFSIFQEKNTLPFFPQLVQTIQF